MSLLSITYKDNLKLPEARPPRGRVFLRTACAFSRAVIIRASANAHLLRAKANDLCLSCHLSTPETVASRYMPTITLTANNTMGHPYERHPVSGSRDPLTGGEMSCMSCHQAHGGTQLHLLKAAAEIPEDAMNHDTETKDMCRQCHLRMWGMEGASSGRKKKTKEKKDASSPPARTVPY